MDILVHISETHQADLTNNALNFQSLFDAQVNRSPDSIALTCRAERISYRELNQRANQLAHYLQLQGVQPESLVGICINRSIDMVVAILGILKSGGAYIPLDPNYPRNRINYILADARAEIVITQEELLYLFPEQTISSICIGRDWAKIQQMQKSSPTETAFSENLAYIIYTSGSTGNPKGVMITHSNICQFAQIASSALDISHDDVYLHSASIAYALSVRQLIIPLLYGATLVIATTEQTRDPLLMFELIKRENISLIDVVPSYWRTSIQRLIALPIAERQELLKNNLRRIVSVGEPLLSDIPKDWEMVLQHKAQLVNIFGQTETTGVVATYPIPSNQDGPVETVPIGTSVQNTELFVLDSHLEPVPQGEVGELCVSNPCLARGYLNRPNLTAQKFIPNPFDEAINTRLYRTGDMARIRSDGNIEFLGRSDFQVKIRGQRLELGEVEAILSEHPNVLSTVAVAHGEQVDEKQLIAFVVPKSKNLTAKELRQFMGGRAPNYMIPTAFIFMDSFPLTPNGKTNRLALSDPEFLASKLHHHKLSPECSIFSTTTPIEREESSDRTLNDVEKSLKVIWQELFKIDQISIYDDFFELGGHSLLGVRMFSRIEHEFGVRLPLTSLFHATTIEQLARIIASYDTNKMDGWSPIVPIQTEGNKPPFFGIHGHEGGVLFWREIVSYLPDNQPFYGVQAQGVDGIMPALKSIEEMASLYLGEIREIQPDGPYYLGGFSMGGEIAFEMGQQLRKQGEQVQLLVMLDTRNPDRVIRQINNKNNFESTPSLELEKKVRRKSGFQHKIIWHLQKFAKLNFWQKIAYIYHYFFYNLKVFLIYALVKIFHSQNKRLPDYLLLRYLRVTHSEALSHYDPKFYPGKITLFRATESLKENPEDSPTGWKALAGGGFEIHIIKATHNIVDPMYSKQVAKMLNGILLENFKNENKE